MTEIPDSDHIVRYASPSKWNKKLKIIKIKAFQLRTEKQEKDLSCNHSEFRSDIIDEIIKDMESHNLIMDKKDGTLFKMNVGTIKKIGQSYHQEISVQRKNNTDSYSGIFGTLPLNDNEEFLAEMSYEASKSLY